MNARRELLYEKAMTVAMLTAEKHVCKSFVESQTLRECIILSGLGQLEVAVQRIDLPLHTV